ncbi:MAG: hypothetical protein WBX25_32360 [Rhodomicrobium sp.]
MSSNDDPLKVAAEKFFPPEAKITASTQGKIARDRAARHAPNLPPRLLTKTQAAAYCGVCVSVFDEVCPVAAIFLADRIPRYDRFVLDEWITGLGGSAAVGLNPILQAWDKGSGNDGYDNAGQRN